MGNVWPADKISSKYRMLAIQTFLTAWIEILSTSIAVDNVRMDIMLISYTLALFTHISAKPIILLLKNV